MTSYWGAAAVNGSTAYFSTDYNVYLYTVLEDKWFLLAHCKYAYFAMAVINDALTTIGGWDDRLGATNTLLSLSGSSWEEVLPPMPTKRAHPSTAYTPTHLVVAGRQTVEVLNTETLQWSTASSLPKAISYPQMTTCDRCIYLVSRDSEVFSCSVEDLLKSTNNSDGGSVWTRLASIPTSQWSTLATLRGHVLAIGGDDNGGNPTGAIHCYDVATNSWSVIGEMPTPRSLVLALVVASNELVVVGGWVASRICSRNYICICPQLTLK